MGEMNISRMDDASESFGQLLVIASNRLPYAAKKLPCHKLLNKVVIWCLPIQTRAGFLTCILLKFFLPAVFQHQTAE